MPIGGLSAIHAQRCDEATQHNRLQFIPELLLPLGHSTSFYNPFMGLEHHGDMLNIEIEKSAGMVQLKCAGRLVHGYELDILRRKVEDENAKTIAIDLAEVSTVDAAGLGTLVFLHRGLECEGRELVLLSAPEYFLRLLRVTNLDGVFTVRDWCAA